jgi:hypothetical protein
MNAYAAALKQRLTGDRVIAIRPAQAALPKAIEIIAACDQISINLDLPRNALSTFGWTRLGAHKGWGARLVARHPMPGPGGSAVGIRLTGILMG